MPVLEKSEINSCCGDLHSCSNHVDLSRGDAAGRKASVEKKNQKTEGANEREGEEKTPTFEYSLRTLIKSHRVGGRRPRQRHFDPAFLLLAFYERGSILDPAPKS